MSSSTRASCSACCPRRFPCRSSSRCSFTTSASRATFAVDPDGRIRFSGHDKLGAEMTEAIMTRLRFSRAEIDATVEAVAQSHGLQGRAADARGEAEALPRPPAHRRRTGAAPRRLHEQPRHARQLRIPQGEARRNSPASRSSRRRSSPAATSSRSGCSPARVSARSSKPCNPASSKAPLRTRDEALAFVRGGVCFRRVRCASPDRKRIGQTIAESALCRVSHPPKLTPLPCPSNTPTRSTPRSSPSPRTRFRASSASLSSKSPSAAACRSRPCSSASARCSPPAPSAACGRRWSPAISPRARSSPGRCRRKS